MTDAIRTSVAIQYRHKTTEFHPLVRAFSLLHVAAKGSFKDAAVDLGMDERNLRRWAKGKR